MKYFRLLGRTTPFVTLQLYTYCGIKCVHGITLDGNHETRARIADVYFLENPAHTALPAEMYATA